MRRNNQKDSAQRLKDVAMWIGVLPVTLITFTVGGKIIEIILLIQNPKGNWPQVITSIIAPTIYWSLAVYVGSVVAPKERGLVCMFLSFFVVGMQFLGVFLYFTVSSPFTWLDLVGFFSTTMGVGFITYKFFTEGDGFRLFTK